MEEPVKGRPPTKFRAPASTAAPGIQPEEKKGHLTKTEIFAPGQSFAHISETLRPILLIFGDNVPHTRAYVFAKGFPPTSSDGPTTSPKPPEIRFSPHISAIPHPIGMKFCSGTGSNTL